MKIATRFFVAAIALAAFVSPVSGLADELANWTFETSLPTTGGPHVAESGFFSASSFATSNSGGTFSNPAGNGTPESFSSNGWDDTEYYQFLSSTVGFEDITISFAQAASNTGPGDFQFQYSTDGVNYTNFGSVYAGPTPDFNGGTFNPANVLTFDLSSVTALSNQSSVGFRIAVSGTRSENNGTIASGGTFRVDDFVINGVSQIPEPSSLTLLGIGVAGLVLNRRRR